MSVEVEPRRAPNNGLGRPKGATNLATREIKQELHRFFSSPVYRESVKQRILEGSAPTIELYFLQLLYGKPKEKIDLHIGPLEEDLSHLSSEELAQRAEDIARSLREAQELEAALPAEILAEAGITRSPVVEQPEVSVDVDASVDAEKPADSSVDAPGVAENHSEPGQ